MAWTKAQQKVIDTRNKNLLVSAAAGSGKTAVLVERIISMISEGENPIDIDHLLVVTFTNAAAAEMRTRIGKAIDLKLQKEPDNEHLQKQISLLQSAQITTIHSFCLNVIRNYFHRIDLDPSFKIAEESEITLMKSDVLSDLLERWYDEGREDFHAFIESYSYSKSDAPVEDLILQLYNFSMSDPWPKRWIEDKRRMFDISTVKEMSEAAWMQELLAYVNAVLGDLLLKNEEALALCEDSDGPTAYEPALESDRTLLELLRNADSYEKCVQSFASVTFDRLSNKKQEGLVQWKKDKVKELRDEVKKGIKDLVSQFFFQPPQEMLNDMQAVGKIMQVLFDLTLEFMDDFAKKKEEKNLIDFNDLEHFALKILVNRQEEIKIPDGEGQLEEDHMEEEMESSACRAYEASDVHISRTQAAQELSGLFEEILIDEYQDSNMVQETILKSISRESMGRPNRFMVGDVKQSIYKFRLAMPEIFMEKYLTYSCDDVTEDGEVNHFQRIDLDKNFRSRKTVLDYVNRIFEQIMQQAVGGIEYDEAASLKYGGLFEETMQNEPDSADTYLSEDIKNRIASDVELLLVTDESPAAEEDEALGDDAGEDTPMISKDNTGENTPKNSKDDAGWDASKTSKDNAGVEDPEEAVYTKKEIEARVIAKKIKELTDPVNGMLVFDKNSGTHRPAIYSDIVILLRSMSNWSEVIVNTLMQEGIPAYAETGTGYFQTLEIMTVLNMLRIIDNPRQDIPLVGVLYSPIVGLSATELAMIRAASRNTGMYLALLSYAGKEDESSELKAKVIAFLEKLENFRSMVNHTPIHQLIQTVLDQTGYYYYVCAMPGGEQRKANIDMLISQAVRFEKGSYSGLFHFIRYIEKLHKYEVDFGEAATAGEQDNSVRIMSIHKSKGLEFPIVFVAAMNKQFNTQDIRSNIVLHSGLGVGPEYIDSTSRTKVPTLIKKVIQKKVQIENMGEELRVLYVAMTRAKEKLILTGYLKSVDEIKQKNFSFFEIMSVKSYLDWVLPAVVNRIGWLPKVINNTLVCKKDGMSIEVFQKNALLSEEITKQIFLRKDEEDLQSIKSDMVYNQELRDEVRNRLNFTYQYQKAAGIKVKMTVSELKKLGQLQDEELSVNLFENPVQNEIKLGEISSPESGQNRNESELKQKDNIQHKNMSTRGDTKTDSGSCQDNNSLKNSIHTPIVVNPTATCQDNNSPEDWNQKADNNDINLPIIDATIPRFISQREEAVTGTDRGTLYHKVLELIQLTRVNGREDITAELDRLIRNKKLKETDIKLLKLDYLSKFVCSDIAKRMRQAEAAHKLYREKQFVIGIKASQVMKDTDSDELILIQGIIDAFFEEDGELVLLDYKSDLVSDSDQLVKRYKVQLEYYRKALEQMLKMKVKEMIIYSLSLGKEIRID